jgi:hypothetical protein
MPNNSNIAILFIHLIKNMKSMRMLSAVIILNLLTVSTIKSVSFDNNLRLYDSFAEIHQAYNGPLRFRQSDWDNIKHESIILRSASENNDPTIPFERRIVRINVDMTG